MTDIKNIRDTHSGAIERIDTSGISGWCSHHQAESDPIKLFVYCNDVNIYSLRTNKIRADIKSKRDGSPTLSGFSIQWIQLSSNTIQYLIQCLSNTDEKIISIRTNCNYFLSDTWAIINNSIYPNIELINSLNQILKISAPKDNHPPNVTSKKPLKILLMTAHFELCAGSEIVLLELAEYLCREHHVTIAAVISGLPIAEYAQNLNIPIIPIDNNLRPFEYDLVWVQNYLLPLCDLSESAAMVDKTYFIFAHLDLNWGLAQAGIILEPILADRYIVHSLSGVEHFADAGLDRLKITPLFNAAPRIFFDQPRPLKHLKRIALISNHPPAELIEAKSILRQTGIEVIHYGVNGDITNQRINPDILKSFDTVITIGKSVQYCIGMRIPVYIYDKYGGPGYLTAKNFNDSSWFNFSGRCCHRYTEGQSIVDEIISGYTTAHEFMDEINDVLLDKFRLEQCIDLILKDHAIAARNLDRLQILQQNADLIKREQALCTAAIHYFSSTIWMSKKISKFEDKYGAIQ